MHRRDCAAAAPLRGEALHARAPGVEHARAGQAAELVARKNEVIAACALHVHGDVEHRLRRVEQHRRPGVVRRAADGSGVVHRAEGVGHPRGGDEAGLIAEQRAVSVHIELARVRHRRDAEHGAGPFAGADPRQKIRVVLHLRDDDLVAGAEELVGVKRREGVHAVGRSGGEENFLRLRRAEKALHGFARGLHFVLRCASEGVGGAVDVAVMGAVERFNRIQHRQRHLERRGIVEVDERRAVYPGI